MARIRFITDLNAEVYISVKGENPRSLQRAVLDTLRTCGELGWRSGNVPPGGYRFPLANERDFDWRLIGARGGTCNIDGEEREGVWHGGLFYSRRELREQERKRLKPAVRYSRGARSTDPPEIIEDAAAETSVTSRWPCSAATRDAARSMLCRPQPHEWQREDPRTVDRARPACSPNRSPRPGPPGKRPSQ